MTVRRAESVVPPSEAGTSILWVGVGWKFLRMGWGEKSFVWVRAELG